jgi:hypothetical protein
VTVTGSTFGVGLWQYAKAQRWKRAEFVAAQIKELEASIGARNAIRNAMMMLDWHDGTLQSSRDGKSLPFSNHMVETALVTETERRGYRVGDGRGLAAVSDLLIEVIADPKKSQKPPEFRHAICRSSPSIAIGESRASFDNMGTNQDARQRVMCSVY